MNIDDITKFANRKLVATGAEDLREKVSKETEEIIKSKVAQDTVYWDLREKHHQVQDENERLQRNLAEAHEQREAANAKYEEEKRQRPELLNKLSSTRNICDVLQDSCERLRQTLSRCKLDGDTLHGAFNKSAEQLHELRVKQEQQNECVKHQVEVLHEKVSSNNHLSKMVEYVTSAKQQVDGELAETRGQLAAALARIGDINRELDNNKYENKMKDEMISRLHQEIQRLADEYNRKIGDANKGLAQKDKQIQEAEDVVQSLEQVAMKLGDERNALQVKVSTLEEEQHRLLAAMEALKIEIQDSNSAKAGVEESLHKAADENNNLKKEIFDAVQDLTTTNKKVEDLRILINSLENDNAEIANELHKMKDENEEQFAQIQQLVTEKKHLEDNAKSFKEIAEGKERDLENKLENKDRDLEIKTNELEEFKNKLDDTLAEVKRNDEKFIKENKKLQDIIKMKEAELAQHMTILLETRNEKERLQASVQALQQTISDMQKQLTASCAQPAKERYVPELDDNAVMMTPSRSKVPRHETFGKKMELKSIDAPTASTAPSTRFGLKAAASGDSLLNFFTDSSDDADIVNLQQTSVKRCFEALSRGEIFSRADLAQTQQIPRAIGPNAKENTVKTRPRKFFKHRAGESKK